MTGGHSPKWEDDMNSDEKVKFIRSLCDNLAGHTLRVLSNHRVIGTFPFPPRVDVANLAATLDEAAQWLRHLGPVAIVVDDPQGVSHVIGRWS